MNKLFVVFLLTGMLTAFLSCHKTSPLESSSINDYYPLRVGRYCIYQLDSSVYVNFGQAKELRRHFIKDTVDAAITDNLGRPSFRVRRLFRSTSDTTQWVDEMAYFVTPLAGSLELVEENLRFIKLVLPIREYITWNGNRYLPDDIYPSFGFNSTTHSRLGSWEYTYENIGMPATVGGRLYDTTITVTSSATDSTAFPPVVFTAPAFKTLWIEKYAKGVGLISRQVSLEEFQPRSSTYPNGYFSGFEVRQTLLRHN